MSPNDSLRNAISSVPMNLVDPITHTEEQTPLDSGLTAPRAFLAPDFHPTGM